LLPNGSFALLGANVNRVGAKLGRGVGTKEGTPLGANVGEHVGDGVGSSVGGAVGTLVGVHVGVVGIVGSNVGALVGIKVGTDAIVDVEGKTLKSESESERAVEPSTRQRGSAERRERRSADEPPNGARNHKFV